MIRNLFSATIGIVCLTAMPASADDTKKPDDPKAMMEAWEKASKPGAEHKKLEPFVGNWTYTARFWMDPVKEPTTSEGKMRRKWIMDGRFVHEEVDGEVVKGQPFIGMGIVGFDNSRKKYVSTWIDSMSTAIANATGTCDASGKEFTFEKETCCPITGQMIKGRDVIKIVSEDKQEMTFFKTVDGKEIKVMEIVALKKK